MLKIAPAKHATLYNISIQSVSAAPRAAAAAAAPGRRRRLPPAATAVEANTARRRGPLAGSANYASPAGTLRFAALRALPNPNPNPNPNNGPAGLSAR